MQVLHGELVDSGVQSRAIMRGSTAGITDGLRGTSRAHYVFLTVLDNLIAACVISPLVVTYWRGTWSLMDSYVYPKDPVASSAVSLAIGLLGILIFTLTQSILKEIFNPDTHRLLYYICTRLYTGCFAFVCVNSWRGAWMALDIFSGREPWAVATTIGLSLLLLVSSKTLRNISAPPFAIVTDRREGYFEVPTMFKKSTGDLWMYILDCTFSVCVIGTLVVFVWRGVWSLMDMYIYPDNLALSAWVSLGIGYGLVAVTFCTQPLVKALVRSIKGIQRLVAVDIYLLFSFFGTINVWRGIWLLLNIYYLPEHPIISHWTSHFIPFLLLVLINSSNSVLVRGVYIDAEEEGEQCVDFPCYYLRLFFQEKRKKKLLKKKITDFSKNGEADGLINTDITKKRPSVQIVAIHSNNKIISNSQHNNQQALPESV